MLVVDNRQRIFNCSRVIGFMSAGSVGERIISRNVPSVQPSPRAVKIPPK